MSSTLATSAPPALEAVDVTLAFGGLTALSGVTLHARDGRTLGIVGPNGAGKTSLLNCFNGAYRPQSGELRIDGKSIVGMRPSQIAALGVARTFQSVSLIPDESVLDNVLVGAHLRLRRNFAAALIYIGPCRRDEKRKRDEADEVMELLGLESLRGTMAGSLPYGKQRLVEIARALVSQPRLLIFDEPTSGMNEDERHEVAGVIQSLQARGGVTQVVVEHDVRFITSVCDDAVVLDFGQVLATGTPKEVFADPRVIEAYIGRARTAEDAE